MHGSYFYAYKTVLDGAISYFSYSTVQYSNMIFVDVGYGPNPMVGKEGDNLLVKMSNIKMYGESPSKDCFYENECDSRWHVGCTARHGMMISYFSANGGSVLPTVSSDIPLSGISSDASWGGKS